MIDDEPTIKIKLPSELRNELKLYIEDCKLEDEELIFQSTRTHQCLSRQQAYRIINRAAEQLGMKHIGLTTLRKTFAYHAYQAAFQSQLFRNIWDIKQLKKL